MLDPLTEIEKLKAELQASRAQIAALETLVAQLRKQNEALMEQLARNSRNSNRPPSSDPPGRSGGGGGRKSKKRGKPKKRRKPGGQVGHPGSHRALLPAEKVTRIEDVFPSRCESCWKPMPEVIDPDARRHQVMEIPPFEPEVTEYRRHAVTCECGYTTRVPFAESQIPTSAFGPRMMSLVALLTGVYHLSRRKAGKLLSDICGAEISVGSISALEGRVSEAVAPAVSEAWEQVQAAEVKHTDGTSWLQSGVALSLWTLASCAATVFKIVASSSRASLIDLYGDLKGILVSDRAKVLNFWTMDRRQVCWAHLLRKFVSFSERDGPAGRFGRELLDYTGILFEYWHDFKDGRLDEKTFQAWMRPVREQLEATLERAVTAQIPRLSGSCADILAHRDALWTFVTHRLVEPTNNHAERELRAFVLWRKRSFGTRSERGNLFAERIMTVAHTARKQGKDVLEFLTACCEARESGTSTPSLFESDIQKAS